MVCDGRSLRSCARVVYRGWWRCVTVVVTIFSRGIHITAVLSYLIQLNHKVCQDTIGVFDDMLMVVSLLRQAKSLELQQVSW